MQSGGITAESLGIQGLRDRIEGWRRSSAKSRSMPEGLWTEASSAAKRLGAGRVARALGLDYEALKQRVIAGGVDESRGSAKKAVVSTGAQFIELEGFSALKQASARDEVVVEVLATDGARLSIRLKSVDVAALVRSFRSRP